MTVVLVISGNSVNCEQVKDILTNNSGLGGEREVSLVMSWYTDQTRALLAGLPQHLAGADAEPFGDIVFGQHNTVACLLVSGNRHRLVPQRGVVQNLHAGIKVVHIRVQYYRLHALSI